MNKDQYLEYVQNEVNTKGYFIRNTFICTYDELSINIKRNKSLNDLPVIEDDEINNIKKELSHNYKPNIEVYTNLTYDYVKVKIKEDTKELIDNWIQNTTESYEENLSIINNILNENTKKINILNDINNTFTKINIKNKNIIQLLTELKNKLKLINNNINFKIIEWLDSELDNLIQNKDKLINIKNSNMKDKLSVQHHIQNLLSKIINKYVEPYIDKLNKDIKEKKDSIIYIKKSYKSYIKLLDKQFNTFLDKYKKKIYTILLDNWIVVSKDNSVTFDINESLTLGNNLWGEISFFVDFTYNIEFKNIY
jgi:hypothetical protein